MGAVCPKCNEYGHFAFECRNSIREKELGGGSTFKKTMREEMEDLQKRLADAKKGVEKKIKKHKDKERMKKHMKGKKDKKKKKSKKHKRKSSSSSGLSDSY